MKLITAMSLMLFLVLLTACEDDDYDDDGKLSIQEFTVTGTNSPEEEIPEVDPYVDNGQFIAYMKASKPDLGFIYELSFSKTETTENAVTLFNIECDDDESCYEPDYYTVGCQFNTDFTGTCDDQSFDLNNYIDQTPFSGYIVAQLCHRIQNTCVLAYQRIIIK